MKKRLSLLTGLMLASGLMVSAQVGTIESKSDEGISIIPAAFTFDSKAKMWTYEYDGESYYETKDVNVSIYDENLSKAKTFNIRKDPYVRKQTKKRAQIVVLSETIVSDYVTYPWPEDWVEGADSVYTAENGAKIYIADYFNEWEYGKKYPSWGWRVMYEEKYDTKALRQIEFKYEYKYDGEWSIEEDSAYIDPYTIYFRELNNNPYGYTYSEDLGYTQTLFNTDEKYEYAFPKYSFIEEKYEEDRDDDGDIDYVNSYWYEKYDGFDIISEDGSIVQSFTFDQGASNEKNNPYFYIYIWGDNTYICMNGYSFKPTYREWYDFYSFDRNTSQITRVANNNTLMRMIPAMPRKNTTVTVELSEESVKEGGQLVVTDMNGRKVYSTSVGIGETSVRVPLSRVASGIYNVTLTNSGQRIENSKLIIR